MANRIERPQPPALPQPTTEYSRRYGDQFNSVLRLFFRRLVGTINDVLSVNEGGKYLYMPRALLYSTVDQAVASPNTGYPVEFENTYLAGGVSIISDTRITVAAAGVYTFQVTLQLAHDNSSDAVLTTWINKDGTDVPYGGQIQTIKGNDMTVQHWNFSIDMVAGGYIEMYWATDDTDMYLHTEAATALHPGVPSAIVAVGFASNL